jgi:hypothetical protein
MRGLHRHLFAIVVFWEKGYLYTMGAVILTPKNLEEQELLLALAKKMSIGAKVLSEEEFEDYSLGLMIKEGMKSRTVSRESVMKVLGK